MTSPAPHRAGHCAVIGRANVGKSTLLNRLVGAKIAIVTPKAQTTRGRIIGIVQTEQAQAALIDTPGVVLGGAPMPRALRRLSRAAATQADVVVVLVTVRPGEAKLDEADEAVLHAARNSEVPRIIAVNKIDKVRDKQQLLPWFAAWAAQGETVIPISARTGEGIETLWQNIVQHLPTGPALYAKDAHTDQTERGLCAEFVREQMLLRLEREVPHSAAVLIEQFEDERDDQTRPICRIWGRIVVEREGQKGIVIGHKGEMLKTISQGARRHIEQMLGCQVFLRLDVKVDEKWTERTQALSAYGIAPPA